ncbi:MAG: helix-turn-helix transcriptional regulator [Rhodobacterales bacterium]|nr:helix-turn-helix transcriptional regulator [Rhodobacterales bacterium]
MTKTKTAETTPRAVAGVRALRDRLAEEVPEFGEAVRLGADAEAFCRAVRQALRAHRKNQHLEQGDLGERLDLSQSAVSRMERGQGDLGLKSVYRYARALGLQPIITFAPSAESIMAGQVGEVDAESLRLAMDFVNDERARLLRTVSNGLDVLLVETVSATRKATTE